MRNHPVIQAMLCLALVVSTASGRAQGAQAEGDPGLPLVRPTPAPAPARATTNAPSASPLMRKDALRLLEEQLSKSLQALAPKSGMDPLQSGRQTPRPRPASTLSKKDQEALDRKLNWAFTRTEDIATHQTPEELMGIPEPDKEGEPKKGRGVVEDYYARLMTEGAVSAGRPTRPLEETLDARRSPGQGEAFKRPEQEPAWVQRAEESLRSLMGGNDRNLFTGELREVGGGAESRFATGLADDPSAPAGSPESYLRQYRQMLNDPALYPTLNANLNVQTPAKPGAIAPLPSLGGLGQGTSASSTRTEGGLLKPIGLPSAISDPNRQVLNNWNSQQSTPTALPASRTPQAPVKVQAPRRSF